MLHYMLRSLLARQRNAIRMAFPWRRNSGPMLCAHYWIHGINKEHELCVYGSLYVTLCFVLCPFDFFTFVC